MNKKLDKYLTSVFEQTSEWTWNRLKASLDLGISQGETTITDIILLDLKAAKSSKLHIIKTPQNKESLQGTDWEWWIGGYNGMGWLRYAVQAKKIDLSTFNYKELKHKVGKVKKNPQIDILRFYAKANDALARYCFYNYVNSLDKSKYWHCNLPFEQTQLGCSMATINTVSKAIRTNSCNFDFIYSQDSTIPLRCLVTCPKILSVYYPKNYGFISGFAEGEEVRIFEDLPENIKRGIDTGSFREWDSEFYSNEISYRPERVLVAELPITDL